MADWFVGPIFEKVIGILFDYLQDQFRWQAGMKAELERLREIHPEIRAFFSAANHAQIADPGSSLNQWIWQLRDAIDEADDLIDDFEYMKHEDQLETNAASSWRLLCRNVQTVGKRALKVDPNLARLEKVVQKLDRVSAKVSTFFNLVKYTEKKDKEQLDELSRARETGSLPANDDFIGRGRDKEFIMQWLMNPSNEDVISLLSVEGHGGLGKTTLLQHVYNDDEITKEFELKMWVCVSPSFDVKKVIVDMLESRDSERTSSDSLDKLQRSLLSVVKSKKFLLVLDDIWLEEQDRDKWEKVFAPLVHGGLGSKILVTTRMHDAASMIAKVINKKNESLILKGLEEDQCLELLNTHAFAGKNPDDHKKLKFITGELVKKFYGCPLATKVIGGVLNSNLDETHWTNMSNNVLGHNEISSILNLSYIFLPKYLQNCLAFCSIFSQDHIFSKDDLVRMWIAVGFIQPSTKEETMEDIGERYFDILVEKSFFDKNIERKYKMHDLVYELAQSVSAQECFRVVGDEDLNLRIPETIRHLSVRTNSVKVLKKIGKCKKLRTLCITYDTDDKNFVHALDELFELTRSIRLLSISACSQTMIPQAVGCLKYLRYLELHYSISTPLPKSVSNLYHLQFIIYNDFCKDYPGDFFPSKMKNLSNLRYMCFNSSKFPEIGKLKFLQELKKFSVENKKGYGIGELKQMNDLRILGINCLENVSVAKDARDAKLCDKRKLEDLSLQWGQPHNSDLEEGVLDNLQPHKNLKKLTITNYMGVRSAKWMKNVNLIANLQNISLYGCLEWNFLPPFGQLRFLKFLCLHDMPKAVRFGVTNCVFESLESLDIFDLDALEDWFDAGVDVLFPRLTQLQLTNCPKLQELPYLPPKLKKLVMKNIGWETLNCCSISKSIPLETLDVFRCPKIKCISLAGEIIGRLEAQIEGCPKLISLGKHQEMGITENITPSVERLQLEFRCIPLKSLPYLPPSLCTLNLKNLDNLDCLPCLSSLSSLRKLHIEKVPQLSELPNLPPSLNELHLHHLDNLNCLPSLSSLIKIKIIGVPYLQKLPDLTTSLCRLYLQELDSLNFLPCLSSLSCLTTLHIHSVPQLEELPDLPSSLRELNLDYLDNLHSLPSSLPNLYSLTELKIRHVPRLQNLLDLPPSLRELWLDNLKSLNCLPSRFPSRSSLTNLHIDNIPQLWELPELPPSLRELWLDNLNNLNCLPSTFPSLYSLTKLHISDVPQLRELPNLPPSLRELWLNNLNNLNCLPSTFPSLSSLTELHIGDVPELRELPNLPPSLYELHLRGFGNPNYHLSYLTSFSYPTEIDNFEVSEIFDSIFAPHALHDPELYARASNVNFLSCLPTLSSLTKLEIIRVPQVRNLPDLPASLCQLRLQELDYLYFLPSLSSLSELVITEVPQLRELLDLSPKIDLQISGCHPKLMKRSIKVAGIPNIYICTQDGNTSTKLGIFFT